MRPLITEIETSVTPDSLTERLLQVPEPLSGYPPARACAISTGAYSFVTAKPFLVFRSSGSRCEISGHHRPAPYVQFGNPWQIMDTLMSRCELLDELDLPFPLGGCFGFWGYDLKNFTEPKLPRRALNDLELPDCHVGFYDSVYF